MQGLATSFKNGPHQADNVSGTSEAQSMLQHSDANFSNVAGRLLADAEPLKMQNNFSTLVQ